MPISHSVGSGGENTLGDVYYVQLLLSDCRCRLALSPIAVDGVAGPKTIEAIRDFQQKSGLTADGRVDPNGATLKAIETMHLVGICNNTYSDSYRKYAKPGPTDVHIRQKLFQPYLKKLRDGMGYTHTAKHTPPSNPSSPQSSSSLFGNA